MSISDYKLLYSFVCALLGLIIASPTLVMVVRLPATEQYSELWILGSGHMAENYPFNVSVGLQNQLYVGVANHMGDIEFYRLLVKFRNETELGPDSVNKTPSPLVVVFEYDIILKNDETWEKLITFSFPEITFANGTCLVSGIVLDGSVAKVQKTAAWDSSNQGFFVQMFFELWRYDPSSYVPFQYDNRFVWDWLNITGS